MKPLIATAAAALMLITAAAHAQDQKPNIVTILTAPEPQTQLMAMVLTMQSIQQGAKARILLCGPAGDLAMEDAPESATAPQQPQGMSPQGLMRKIMEAGAPIEVCAIYLPNKGIGADALIEGIGAANPQEMAAHLLAPDTRLLTF